MLKNLLILMIFVTSCGSSHHGKHDARNNDQPKVDVPKKFSYVDSEKNIEVATDNEQKYQSSIDKGIAEAKVWGVSNSSSFTPDLPVQQMRASFTVSAKESNQQKLASTLDLVIQRMQSRCPIFGENRKWKPVKLEFEKTESVIKKGGQLQTDMSSWSWSSKKYISSFGPVFGDRVERIVLWNDDLLTFSDEKGRFPWEVDPPSISPNILGYSNIIRHQVDITLAHEISHWFVRSLLNENGRIDIQTSYFSEVLAQWITGVCYVNNFEDKALTQKSIDDEEKKDPQKLWPVPNNVTDTRCFDPAGFDLPKDDLDTYIHAIGSDCGLAGVLSSLVYYDRFESKSLMEATVSTILEMKGEKLHCRADDSSCYGLFSYYNSKLITSDAQRPLVFSLKEFVSSLENKISIPEKSLPMWNRYKEVIFGVES